MPVTGKDLKLARKQRGWTQQQAAKRLGVTQAYLSMLEGGRRKVPDELAVKVASRLDVSPLALPPEQRRSSDLAADLGSLGYRGFAYLTRGSQRNPASLLLDALSREHLDARVTESLPWLVFEFADLNWDWLRPRVKVRDRQNRLGFVVSVARQMAVRKGEKNRASRLLGQENRLKTSRLVMEDSLAGDSLTQTEREWLRKNRSEEAKFWNVLTDMRLEHLDASR